MLVACPPNGGLPADAGAHWSSRLLRLVKVVSMLHTANSYVSTLGGGYFLCRRIGPALALARLQMLVARAMGDPRLEARCWVHIAYSLVQAGKFRSASLVIRYVAVVAKHTSVEDPTLATMAHAAMRHCRRSHRLYASGELTRSAPGDREAALRDEFYRQRLAAVTEGMGRWLCDQSAGLRIARLRGDLGL